MIFITELNTDNFDDFVKDDFTLVDIWVEWSQLCKDVSPIVDEISTDFSDKLSVGRLNFDNNKEIVLDIGVRDLPSVILYKNGEVVDQVVGSVTREILVDMINLHIPDGEN